MSRVPLSLALTATPLLLLVSITATSDLVPFWVPPVVVLLGLALLLWGAVRGLPRIGAAGLLVAAIGIGLTGVSLALWQLGLGILGLVLAVAALNLTVGLTGRTGNALLYPVAVLLAAVGTVIGILLALGLGALGGGGADARTGVTATAALVAAITWGLVRWSGRGGPVDEDAT